MSTLSTVDGRRPALPVQTTGNSPGGGKAETFYDLSPTFSETGEKGGSHTKKSHSGRSRTEVKEEGRLSRERGEKLRQRLNHPHSYVPSVFFRDGEEGGGEGPP